jgi:hypothetical protein
VTAQNVFLNLFFIAIRHESFENLKSSLLIEKLFTILTTISRRGYRKIQTLGRVINTVLFIMMENIQTTSSK